MKRVISAAALVVATSLVAPVAIAYTQDAPIRARVSTEGAFVAEARAIPETLELTGLFEPADLVEVKIDLESFNQPLKVEKVAEHGQQVKKGDVLLAVEADAVQRALATAQNKKAVADVNLSKAETDARVGNESDALALRQAQRRLAKAEEAVSWFESVDGVNLLEQADMLVQRSEDSVEDQAEELEQLRKMYQSEELTQDTADIVVKRALRQLEYTKRQLELNRLRAQKMREKDYADAKQDLVDALDAHRLANVQLENDQAARKVQREASLLQAREAARQATEEYEKLVADSEKLVFTAPADGYVFYGQLNDGNWSGATPDAVEAGDDIKPDQTVMTFYRPGGMQVVVDLPEKDRFRLQQDAVVKVTPSALPDEVVEAKITRISPLAVQKGPARVFQVTLELPEVDPRVAPGFSAKAELPVAGESRPMVPAAYVKEGKLRVKQGDEIRTVDVKTGKTEGELIQVVEGIEAGATVFPPEAAEAETAQ